MSENVDNFAPELLRGMRADIARVVDGQDTMRAELLVIRQHDTGLVGLRTSDDGQIAGSAVRVERIERRLELTD